MLLGKNILVLNLIGIYGNRLFDLLLVKGLLEDFEVLNEFIVEFAGPFDFGDFD